MAAFPSKVRCGSEGLLALDLRESKLKPRFNARPMLFFTRAAGPLGAGDVGLLLDWVVAGLPRENAMGGTGGLLVLTLIDGRPPMGSNGSRLCFMRVGAENCRRISSSSRFLISKLPCAPADSGPCVLPERFSELVDRRGSSGASWNNPGSGAIIGNPLESSADSAVAGRWNARKGRKKLVEGRMPPACVVLFVGLCVACWKVVTFGAGEGTGDAGICTPSLSACPALSKLPPIGRVGVGCMPLVEVERPYGRDVLARVGLGKVLMYGWDRDALKLAEGRGNWAGLLFDGDVGSGAGNECVAMVHDQ